MESLGTLAETLQTVLASFMLAVARLSPIVFLLPGIGENFLSVRVKLAVLLALSSSLLASGVVPQVPIEPFSPYLAAILLEFAMGLKMALLLRALTWILTIVGNIIANMIGLSQMLGMASNAESQTVLANLLVLAGTALLLTADFHALVFAELVRSYAVPATDGAAVFSVQDLFVGFSRAFNFAVALAWPFVAASLIYNLCLGFINRAMPQLMVAFVGAPFMIGAGLILLVASVFGVLMAWRDRSFELVGLG